MNMKLMNGVALLLGGVFGLGLCISGMLDPAKVLNFLDVAGGHWDPTLAFVMGGAVFVATPAFWLSKRRLRPLLAPRFQLPTSTKIDRKLVTGAAIFGAGWGLGGFCPGPAVTALSTALWPVFGFFAAMILGQWLADRWNARSPARAGHAASAGSEPAQVRS